MPSMEDIGPMATSHDFLYPDSPAVPCPGCKDRSTLSRAADHSIFQWIEQVLKIDHKNSNLPRVYCAYCDMNNHPRFTCKHAWKHRKPAEKHRCTLCAGRHPPFLCPIAQINGGEAQPIWYKIEYKRAKQETPRSSTIDGDPTRSLILMSMARSKVGSQVPAEAPQPQCSAAAMMHGLCRPPMSSYQGGCPTIAEHQELRCSLLCSQEVILPNPGYKIAANLWDLDIPRSAREPGPLGIFSTPLQHYGESLLSNVQQEWCDATSR